MPEWFRARKTAVAEVREANAEDEAMIRRREDLALATLGLGGEDAVWPHYYVMRGGEGEEYPIARAVFAKTYERL